MLPTIRLLKAARVLLGWSQRKLSQESGVHQSVIGRIEGKDGSARPVTLQRLARAMEREGIVFFSELLLPFGFVSMFLSGGRNAFFISIIFVFFFNVLFLRKDIFRKKNSFLVRSIFWVVFLFSTILWKSPMDSPKTVHIFPSKKHPEKYLQILIIS